MGNWESIPDIQSLVSISKFYNVTLDEIINGRLNEQQNKDKNLSTKEKLIIDLNLISYVFLIIIIMWLIGPSIKYESRILSIAEIATANIVGSSLQLISFIFLISLFILLSLRIINLFTLINDYGLTTKQALKYIKISTIVLFIVSLCGILGNSLVFLIFGLIVTVYITMFSYFFTRYFSDFIINKKLFYLTNNIILIFGVILMIVLIVLFGYYNLDKAMYNIIGCMIITIVINFSLSLLRQKD